jgi:hypothetical protein
MSTVQEILDTEIPPPTFVLRPGRNAPLPDGTTFTRPSGAWAKDPVTGEFVKKDPDVARIDGPFQDLLIEADSRTNLLDAPNDINDGAWGKNDVTITDNAGSAFGENYDTIVEDNATDILPRVQEEITTSDGDPVAVSVIARKNGRGWLFFNLEISDNDGNYTYESFWFDLENGVTGTTQNTQSSVLVHEIDQEGVSGDWYRCKVVISPDSGWSFNNDRVLIRLANGDGVTSYDGDGTSGIDVLQAQVESPASNVSSPIFEGNTTRSGDDFTIFEGGQPDWWNSNEMTFIVDIIPTVYNIDNYMSILTSGEPNYNIQMRNNNFRFVDGAANSTIGTPSPFTRHTVGVTDDGSTKVLSVDGQSVKSISGGDFLASSKLEVGISNNLIALIKNKRFITKALSESTLNNLTS